MSTVVLTKEQIAEALDLHAKWYRGEPGGQRANLAGANLTGANLAGANLDRTGLLWAECAWTDHGECGRRLMPVVLLARAKTEELEAREQSVTYMYGCYRGTEAELREYIADGDKDFAHSRTCAADFVAARVAEMLAKHV
jgi:hypothetical protein